MYLCDGETELERFVARGGTWSVYSPDDYKDGAAWQTVVDAWEKGIVERYPEFYGSLTGESENSPLAYNR